MAIKDVIVHLDTQDPTGAGGHRQSYAISMAAALDAHLTGVALALEPMIPPMVMGEVPAGVIETQRKRMIETAEAALKAFDEEASRAGVKYEGRIIAALEGSAANALAHQIRTADLAVLGQVEPKDGFPLRNLLIEEALFESGRPVLIVPYIGGTTFKLDRAVVAWDGSREAARAVHEALPLLHGSKEVEILIVDAGSTEDAREAGADLARHLARHGLDVELKTVPSGDIDVANAILAFVGDTRPDLVVMGGYGHSRLREFLMGGATRGMLQSMTSPVLMAH